MITEKVEKVRGMMDILSEEFEARAFIEQQVTECFRSFGYRPIEIPIIESTNLYLRKSGEDIVSRLYDFTYQNRRLCLRPEMTASIIRAYVDNLQSNPLPARLFYSGPVFRYEKPQRGRQRQFTQTGIELIGASGVMADSEVISLACQGLEKIGLKDYHLVIGNVGILTRFLEDLSLDSYLRSFLLANAEPMRHKGKQFLIDRVVEIFPAYHPINANQEVHDPLSLSDKQSNGRLAQIFTAMDEADAHKAIFEMLEGMNIEIGGSRPTDEIVSRLLTKIIRHNQKPQVRSAVDFLHEISQLTGDPTTVLAEASQLLKTYNLGQEPLDEIRAIIQQFRDYEINPQNIQLDLGLSRGLQYYTGMIFEIHHGLPGEETQVCGGGRYDDLISTMGGKKNIPGAGFAYGLERVKLALEENGSKLKDCQKGLDALVIPVSEADQGYATKITNLLRKNNTYVEVDVRGRSVTSNMQYANNRNMPFVIIVGSDEKSTGQVLLKNMKTGETNRTTPDEAAKIILNVKHE